VTDLVIILTTVPADGLGDRIARVLVDEQLAACVNVLPPMSSTYRWRGAVETESEQQVAIKTRASLADLVMARVRELHTYELPELLVLNVAAGSDRYLQWVREGTRSIPAEDS
jgi:periplasmic divalent cation tolerance protein